MKYKPCNKCGHEILASAKFCDECGNENYVPQPWNPPKRKPTLINTMRKKFESSGGEWGSQQRRKDESKPKKDESKPVKIAKTTGLIGCGITSTVFIGLCAFGVLSTIFYVIPMIILSIFSGK